MDVYDTMGDKDCLSQRGGNIIIPPRLAHDEGTTTPEMCLP